MSSESSTAFPSDFARLQQASDLAVQNSAPQPLGRIAQIQAACEEFTRLCQPKRSLTAVPHWYNNSPPHDTPAKPEIT